MGKKFDVAVKVGTYEKDGATKNRYENVGVIIDGPNGEYMIMNRTFNPAGVPNPENRSTVILSLFEAQPNQQQASESEGFNEQ